jgi:hypothetical protein
MWSRGCGSHGKVFAVCWAYVRGCEGAERVWSVRYRLESITALRLSARRTVAAGILDPCGMMASSIYERVCGGDGVAARGGEGLCGSWGLALPTHCHRHLTDDLAREVALGTWSVRLHRRTVIRPGCILLGGVAPNAALVCGSQRRTSHADLAD